MKKNKTFFVKFQTNFWNFFNNFRALIFCFLFFPFFAGLAVFCFENKFEPKVKDGLYVSLEGQVENWVKDESWANIKINEEKKSLNQILRWKATHIAYKNFANLQGWSVALRNRGFCSIDFKNSCSRKIEMPPRGLRVDPLAQREVSAIDPNGRFIASKLELFEVLWQKDKVRLRKLIHNLPKSAYFTSIYSNKDKLYIGTSVNGLFVAKIKKKLRKSLKKRVHFFQVSKGLPYVPHNQRISFYEEISGIIKTKGGLWVATTIQGDLFFKKNDSSQFIRVNLNPQKKGYKIFSMIHYKKGVLLACENGLWRVIFQNSVFEKQKFNFPFKRLRPGIFAAKYGESILQWNFPTPPNKLKLIRMEKSKSRRLIYSSPIKWGSKKWPKIKKILSEKNFNGVVIDLKDELGRITYDTRVKFAQKIGARRPQINLEKVVSYTKTNHIYLVGRIVVFKDPILQRQPGFAILDSKSKTPWVGIEKERWIDPYNPAISKDYLIPLAKEIEQRGIDEIQLDYIRFPSDGNISRMKFRHRPKNAVHIDALESFLAELRSAVSIPISADIYGYNGIYRTSGIIGQDIRIFGHYMDVICPMSYSSHFGDFYMTKGIRKKRVYNLMVHAGIRSKTLAADQFIVRHWLQAFKMRSKLWGYGKNYINNQVQGLIEQNLDSFSFWGSIHDMERANYWIQNYKNK